MSLNFYFTPVPDTARVGTYPGCALPVMSMRIGTTAAAVPCGSLYQYVVCIVSEGGRLLLHVRVFRVYSYPLSIYVLTLTPLSGVLAKKKTFVGKQTWLASPMIDATVVLVYE